jgi:tartrate dehydrogenase/decarboxylase/D-malate dehydrogenase
MAGQFPEVKVDKYHIDILTANFVLHPDIASTRLSQ